MNNYFSICTVVTLLIISAQFIGIPILSAQENTVEVTMKEYPNGFRNPMKGLREFFLKGVDKIRDDYPYPFGSMIKEYIPWNEIESNKNDGIDKVVEYSNYRFKDVEKQNIKVIPRVFIVWLEPWHGGKPKNPKNPDDLNGWHWPDDIPNQVSPYKQIPGSWGSYVEINDSIVPITGGYFDESFPSRVNQLVEKIGKAWDNDPRVAYVEMGIIGEWGEHHDPNISTFWPPHDEPKHVDNRTWVPGIEKTLGDAFTKAFKNKKVMVRYAYDFKDYEFGFYWDSWSQKDEQVRGYEAMRALGNRWESQPIGGEITWNWGDLGKFKSFEQVIADPEYMDLTIEQIRNLHCNHLGGITWANFNDPVFKKNVDSLQRALGYRFVIDKAQYSKTIKNNSLTIEFKLSNTGSSPFYYNWPVEVALLDPITKKKVWGKVLSNVQISSWLPGDDWDIKSQSYTKGAKFHTIKESIDVDKSIKKGKYILAISVLDPSGNLPSLRFANSNYINGGYTAFGYIAKGVKMDNHIINDFDDVQNDRSLYYILK